MEVGILLHYLWSDVVIVGFGGVQSLEEWGIDQITQLLVIVNLPCSSSFLVVVVVIGLLETSGLPFRAQTEILLRVVLHLHEQLLICFFRLVEKTDATRLMRLWKRKCLLIIAMMIVSRWCSVIEPTCLHVVSAILVYVLHHLSNVPVALEEMSRVVGKLAMILCKTSPYSHILWNIILHDATGWLRYLIVLCLYVSFWHGLIGTLGCTHRFDHFIVIQAIGPLNVECELNLRLIPGQGRDR